MAIGNHAFSIADEPDATQQVLKWVLAAPVHEVKGTLHSFKRIADATFLIAKSGTSQTPAGLTHDKGAVGSFRF